AGQAKTVAAAPSRWSTRTRAPRRRRRTPSRPAGGSRYGPGGRTSSSIDLLGAPRRRSLDATGGMAYRLTTWTSTRNEREAAISSARSAGPRRLRRRTSPRRGRARSARTRTKATMPARNPPVAATSGAARVASGARSSGRASDASTGRFRLGSTPSASSSSSGMDARSASMRAPPVPQELRPPEGEQAPVHALQNLVYVGHREGHRRGLPVGGLGDHHPVLVEDRLHLLGGVHHLLAPDRDEAPVVLPGGVVDVHEAVDLLLEIALSHVAHLDPVLRLELLGELPEHGEHRLTRVDPEVVHKEVHRLLHAIALDQALVVGRMIRLLDHRGPVEALDDEARLVVHREVHGPDHAIAAAF